MNKNLIIILAALILLIIPINVNASLSCEVTTNCQYTDVFHISALTNAHAEINTQTNYNQKICCKDTNNKILGTICNQDSSNALLHLSALTNAHAEKNSESSYTNKVCLSATDYTILYIYSQDCSTYDTCILSLSTGNTNLHVGDCSAYSTKLCASFSTTSPSEQSLNRAYWDLTTAQEGDIINLIVEANSDAIGKTASFTIIEDDDLLGYDLVNYQPASAVFTAYGSDSRATTTWIAEWQEDGLFGILGDPEYKFTAYVDNLQIVSSEPKLTVSKSLPSCGDGNIDNGENCQTCPDDAGCGSGNLCCTADSPVSCETSCTNTPDCNNNGICNDDESCNCQDCDNEQSGCGSNEACDYETETCSTIFSEECVQDGCDGGNNCNPECATTLLDCPSDPDCTCEEYGNFIIGISYNDCSIDKCSPGEWDIKTECCTGVCGSTECFSGWTCPEWSKCSNGFRTRGACSRTTALPEGCDDIETGLLQQQKKECIETVKFPVYDNLNLLFSVLILMGYYLVKKRF